LCGEAGRQVPPKLVRENREFARSGCGRRRACYLTLLSDIVKRRSIRAALSAVKPASDAPSPSRGQESVIGNQQSSDY